MSPGLYEIEKRIQSCLVLVKRLTVEREILQLGLDDARMCRESKYHDLREAIERTTVSLLEQKTNLQNLLMQREERRNEVLLSAGESLKIQAVVSEFEDARRRRDGAALRYGANRHRIASAAVRLSSGLKFVGRLARTPEQRLRFDEAARHLKLDVAEMLTEGKALSVVRLVAAWRTVSTVGHSIFEWVCAVRWRLAPRRRTE